MRKELETEYREALIEAAEKLKEAKADDKLIDKLHQIAGYITARAEIEKQEREKIERQ